jgi:hypothetical protein
VFRKTPPAVFGFTSPANTTSSRRPRRGAQPLEHHRGGVSASRGPARLRAIRETSVVSAGWIRSPILAGDDEKAARAGRGEQTLAYAVQRGQRLRGRYAQVAADLRHQICEIRLE